MLDTTKDWTGEDIKKLCADHGISQTRLAKLLRVRAATVSDWMRGVVKPSGVACVALGYVERELRGRGKKT